MYYVVLGSKPSDLTVGIFTSLSKARKFAQEFVVYCAIFDSYGMKFSIYPKHRS